LSFQPANLVVAARAEPSENLHGNAVSRIGRFLHHEKRPWRDSSAPPFAPI